MQFKRLTPMLGVADVARSRQFYQNALGFRCLGEFEHGGVLRWCHLVSFGVELMLSRIEKPGPHDRDGREKTSLYFYPDDVVALHDAVRGKGFPAADVCVMFYQMNEFTLQDPDGYQLVFGQPTDEPPNAQD